MPRNDDENSSTSNEPDQPQGAQPDSGEMGFPDVSESGEGDSGMGAGKLAEAADEPAVTLAADEGGQDRPLGTDQMPDEDAVVPGVPELALEMPPQESARGMPLFNASAFAGPGPGSGRPGDEPEVQGTPFESDRDLLDHFVTRKRLDDLWERIGKASDSITRQIQSVQIARVLFDQVKFARNELMAGRDHFENAERYISEVEYRISQSDRIRKWSYILGSALFVYEIVIAVIVVVLFLNFIGERAFEPNGSRMLYLQTSMLWGTLGGVMGAMMALYKHVAIDQDFEWQHTLWYLTSPIMGTGVGAVIYLIILTGLVGLVPANMTELSVPWTVYILAFLSGYQHNVFTDIIKRILKVFETQLAPQDKQPKA